MGSVLRSVKKRKKSRRLGEVEIIRREDYEELELDGKVEAIRALVPLGLLHVAELLDDEVRELAGERYVRKPGSIRGRRHGSNPGTVGLAGQRVPIRVPRVRSVTGREVPLRSYEALHGDREANDVLLKRVLYGISCRNYEAAAESIPGAIGLSSSDTTEGTASPASVTFTSANWNVAQTVTVTGVNDDEDDGDVVYSIITSAATSGDVWYNGMDPADVSAANTDDDTAGVTLDPPNGQSQSLRFKLQLCRNGT